MKRSVQKRLKVKRLLNSLLVCFALVPLLCFGMLNITDAATTAAKHYTELQFPKLPDVKLPKYERYVLNNGMVVYLMENRELPLISGSALIRTGDRLEPGEKVGLAQLTGTVMRSGGTLKHSPDELNQLLEQRAASVETGVGESFGTAGFEALTEDVDTVFGLFAEVPLLKTSWNWQKPKYGVLFPVAMTIQMTLLIANSRN
jgi:zinc protease